MKRVDFKQGVLQAGPGKMEKWVPCCQRSSEAGYIVLERACSVFKSPHKTLTVLPLSALTLQSTKKYEIRGKRKPWPSFLSCVNPVVTSTLSHHMFLWCWLNSFKLYLSQIFFSFSSFCHLLSSCFSSLGDRFLYILFFSFCPHQNPGQGSPKHSRIARGEHLCVHECWQCMPLFVNAVWYVHGFLSDYGENVFRSSHQISSSLSLQISHPLPHQRHW